jgi:hypothetical protein
MPFTIPSSVSEGDPASANNALLFSQTAIEITNAMKAQGYNQLASEWNAFYPNFHAQNPDLTAFQVESAFIGEAAAKGIAGAVGQTATAEGQIPGAAATGAENALANINPLSYLGNIADFFHRLTEGSTWLRVGEVLAGAMLIYVGIHASLQGSGSGPLGKAGRSATGHGKTAFSGGQSFGKLLWEMIVVPK